MLSTMSKKFRLAANSDHVWEGFLPVDIISRRAVSNKWKFGDPWKKIGSDTLHAFPTKKDLYFFLSGNPLIIDDGSMYFWLEKLSGNKCFGIGPLKLIKPDPAEWKVSKRYAYSTFGEVPVLFHATNLEVEGKISTSLLSPDTNYTAYLFFSFPEWYVFRIGVEQQLETCVVIDGHGENRNVYIPKPSQVGISVFTGPQYPVQRHDGWYEVELGDYLNKESGVDSSELRMSLKEVKSGIRKGGISLYRIEIRPKSSKIIN